MRLSYQFVVLLLISRHTETKVVKTNNGYVDGLEAESRDARTYYTWKGIPYAEPPVGSLRFEPPIPAKPWKGTLKAYRNSPACSQIDLYFEAYQGQEDCLYLSIHVPKVAQNEINGLPVLFAIHGGYFSAGEGRDTAPDYIMDENVILVTPNYRLGLLGFLNTGDEVVRGNMGLKDIRLALKWVYENIEYFGGDSQRITVQGESAGAVASHYLTLSNSSSIYVHKAILHSGTTLTPWALNRNPKRQALDFAQRVNCAAKSTETMISCIRKLEPAALLEKMKGTSVLFADLKWDIERIFAPTVETIITSDTFLAAHPREILTSGYFKPIPIMLGSNSGEGLLTMSVFANNRKYRELFRKKAFWTDVFSQQFLNLPPEQAIHANEIKQYYLGNASFDPHSLETFFAIRDIYSDTFYYTAQQDSLRLHLAKTQVHGYFYNKSSPFSIFDLNRAVVPEVRLPRTLQLGLEFSGMFLDRSILRKPPINYGVSHGDDVLMISPVRGLSLAYRYGRYYQFSKQFVKLLTDFASDKRQLSFQGKLVPQMRRENEFSYFVLNDEPNSGMQQVPFKDRYIFWKTFQKRYTA